MGEQGPWKVTRITSYNVCYTKLLRLQYGRIPELEKQLADAASAEQRETTLLRNNVTEEEVAEIVSKWTGILV